MADRTSPSLAVPEAALRNHLAIVGKTGSGKTFAAKGLVEWLIASGRRVCVVDPTGVWWGLRASPDGSGPGLPVVVIGGDHADIPITAEMGSSVAEWVAGEAPACVLDVSDLSRTKRQSFVAAFMNEIRRANRTPLHLVLDEADEFAPQSALPDTRVVLGSEIQLKALAAWREGREIPPETEGRTTFTYLGHDGRHWIDHQGSEVISRLWAFGDELINVPMMEQPDRHFGAWAERRIAEAYHRREPQYARIRAIVQDTATPRLMNYTALLLPDGDGRVRSLSAVKVGT